MGPDPEQLSVLVMGFVANTCANKDWERVALTLKSVKDLLPYELALSFDVSFFFLMSH